MTRYEIEIITQVRGVAVVYEETREAAVAKALRTEYESLSHEEETVLWAQTPESVEPPERCRCKCDCVLLLEKELRRALKGGSNA